ncbi:uncharacterized protein [Vulpes vulpes]|uniref:Uncharacterized protein isoform X2 n=1 Tax=Vulpes vulpes TaxID=9627 RepID=A0ABM4YTV3_VULVU
MAPSKCPSGLGAYRWRPANVLRPKASAARPESLEPGWQPRTTSRPPSAPDVITPRRPPVAGETAGGAPGVGRARVRVRIPGGGEHAGSAAPAGPGADPWLRAWAAPAEGLHRGLRVVGGLGPAPLPSRPPPPHTPLQTPAPHTPVQTPAPRPLRPPSIPPHPRPHTPVQTPAPHTPDPRPLRPPSRPPHPRPQTPVQTPLQTPAPRPLRPPSRPPHPRPQTPLQTPPPTPPSRPQTPGSPPPPPPPSSCVQPLPLGSSVHRPGLPASSGQLSPFLRVQDVSFKQMSTDAGINTPTFDNLQNNTCCSPDTFDWTLPWILEEQVP